MKDHMKTLKQPARKHPVERIIEDIVRSAHADLDNATQTEIYNDLMVNLFETIRTRAGRGQQPVRISDGNKVWESYRNLYTDGNSVTNEQFERACKGAFDLYTGRIPSGYGRG